MAQTGRMRLPMLVRSDTDCVGKGTRSTAYVEPVGSRVHGQPRHEPRREETTPPTHEVLVGRAGCPLVAQFSHHVLQVTPLSGAHERQERRAIEPPPAGPAPCRTESMLRR